MDTPPLTQPGPGDEPPQVSPPTSEPPRTPPPSSEPPRTPPPTPPPSDPDPGSPETPPGDTLAASEAHLVKDAVPGKAGPSLDADPVAWGGRLYFMDTPFAQSGTLWKSDGTWAGTAVVPLPQDPEPFNPVGLLATDRQLLLLTQGALWSLDGASQGIRRVKDFPREPEEASPLAPSPVGPPTQEPVLFLREGPSTPERWPLLELWRSDGTGKGTWRVRELELLSTWTGWTYRLGDTFLFSFYSDFLGYMLWGSDGTEAGTLLLAKVSPNFRPGFPTGQSVVGGTLFLQVTPSIRSDFSEVWKTDGTPGGTVRIDALSRRTDELYLLGALGQAVYFVTVEPATHVASINRLVVDDSGGTRAEFLMTLPDSQAWQMGLVPSVTAFTVAGGKLFFVVGYYQEGSGGQLVSSRLWVTDGTKEGTARLHERVTPNAFGCPPFSVEGQILFGASDEKSTSGLWASDGTQEGTRRLPDTASRGHLDEICSFTRVGSSVFFVADDGVHGREVWVLPLRR